MGNQNRLSKLPIELTDVDKKLIKHVGDGNYTMSSMARLVNTLKACQYVVHNNIPGDFVECGVWRGGNGILAQKVFKLLNSKRKVWMFDTFEGMTAPTDLDVEQHTQVEAKREFLSKQTKTHNEWCYASLDDVRKNCIQSGLDLEEFRFIKGDVCQSLRFNENLPAKISVLRLDTDWYESTKSELEILYPKLTNRGVLIIDDYGYWEGARKAVDEYFSTKDYRPLFDVIDSTGRSTVKID